MGFKINNEQPLNQYYELNYKQMIVRKFIDEFLANTAYTEASMDNIKLVLSSLKDEIDYLLKIIEDEKVNIKDGMYDFNDSEGDEDFS